MLDLFPSCEQPLYKSTITADYKLGFLIHQILLGGSEYLDQEFEKRMALGKKCGSNGLGLGFVQYTRSLSRKRIVVSNNMEVDSTVSTPLKKQCSGVSFLDSEKSLLEALPQDILIRILCGVTHDDLKQLVHVSKLIKEATLIAKKWHFAYSTPTKSLPFRDFTDLEDSGETDEVEAPNAPKQLKCYRSRLDGKNMANISVALFAASPEEDQWPRKELFMDMEE